MSKKYIKPDFYYDGKYRSAYKEKNPKVGCASTKEQAHKNYCKVNGMEMPKESFWSRILAWN